MKKDQSPFGAKKRRISFMTVLTGLPILGLSALVLVPTYAASNDDICVTATRVDDSKIVAKNGFCEPDISEPTPEPSGSSNPTVSPTATPTASTAPTPDPTMTPAPPVTSPPPVNNFATVTISKTASNVSVHSVAVSSDGTKMLVGSKNGYLHTSTDSGNSFTLRNIPGSWPRVKVAISADGKTLLSSATDSLNRQAKIWVSNDSGNTWLTSTPVGSWGPVDMTPDASMMVVANDYGYGYYYSTDKGVTWKNKYIPKPAGDTTNRYIRGISLSNDGKTILVGDTLNVYLSKDSGATWTHQPALKGSWRGVSVSGDGNTLIVSTSSGTSTDVMISTDNGANWRKVDQLTGGGWGDISMSDDGTKILASKLKGSLFTSIDSGLNWVEHSSASTGDWYDVEMLPDGSKFYAADNATGKTTVGTFGP